MPRLTRIHVARSLYHTIARGNGGQKTFLDEKDYQAFAGGSGELKRTTLFSVYAYCLMPNVFHVLIETRRFPLSLIMQRLLTRFVRSFNFRHHRIEHLFQGRYKAILRWLSDRETRIADLPNKATLMQVVQERQGHARTEFRDSNLFGH